MVTLGARSQESEGEVLSREPWLGDQQDPKALRPGPSSSEHHSSKSWQLQPEPLKWRREGPTQGDKESSPWPPRASLSLLTAFPVLALPLDSWPPGTEG